VVAVISIQVGPLIEKELPQDCSVSSYEMSLFLGKMSLFNDGGKSSLRNSHRKETSNTDTTNDTVLWVECGN